MLNLKKLAVATLAAITTLGVGTATANAAETFDDGFDTYSWYTAEGKTPNLADIETVGELATSVPYCESDYDAYVACYHHDGDPDTDMHMVDTLYWGHVKVVAIDDVITSITER